MKRIYSLTFLLFTIVFGGKGQSISVPLLMEMKQCTSSICVEHLNFDNEYYYVTNEEAEDGIWRLLYQSLDKVTPPGAKNGYTKRVIITLDSNNVVIDAAHMVYTQADVDIIIKQFLDLGCVVGKTETEEENTNIIFTLYSSTKYPTLEFYIATSEAQIDDDKFKVYMLGVRDK